MIWTIIYILWRSGKPLVQGGKGDSAMTMKRRMLLALLALALPLLACSGAEMVGDMAGKEIGAITGHNLCIKGCADVELEFSRYEHGEYPDCWCVKADGEEVLLW